MSQPEEMNKKIMAKEGRLKCITTGYKAIEAKKDIEK